MKKNILKNKFYNFIKKVLVITIITTNLFSFLPIVSFAVDEIDKRYPATVPAVADEIISRYVNTKTYGDNGTSSGYAVINTYEESGKDWRTITEVTAQNGKTRTYRNYKQYNDGNTYHDKYYDGGDIWHRGCGPTAVAIVLSGYRYDVTPADVVDVMAENEIYYTGPSTLSDTLNIFNIEHSLKYVQGNNDSVVKEIRENLEQGRPVMIGVGPGEYTSSGHWMVLVGIEGDTVTISNPGRDNSTDKLSKLVAVDMQGCGYIVITEEKDYTGSGSITSSNKNKSSKKTSSSPTGNGQASTTKCELTNGGYDVIFTSGTTGRQFKEFKQNIPGWGSKYKISHLPGTNGDWDGECGLVSTMIIGSGYSEKATFEDATNKMEDADGWTSIPTWTGDYTGQSVSFVEYDSDEMVDKLSKGCVAIIHGTSGYVSSGGTHYMAILDIKPDKSQVYLSNPWNGSKYQGWISVETINNYFGADIIAYVTNDGSIVNYDGGGSIVTTLDNFLFIGDSRTEAIESDLKKLGNNITAIGITSSKPSDWEQATKTGSGAVLGRTVKLPLKSGIKGISVALGVNATNEMNSMKNVLTNLLERYPDTPIFVNSVFYVGSGYFYNVFLDADKMNANIDQFNEEIKEFCNNNSNLIYIDITKDLYESNYLKSTYTNDDLHLNYEGNKILVENIKNEILGSGKLTNNTVNMSKNIVENGRGGYKIDIDLDEEVETMLERLEEEDYDIEKYVKGWFKKKRLKNMIKAAIVTQYPDLRSADEIASDTPIPTDIPMLPDEVQGCVKIKRYTDEETKNSFVAASLTNPIDKDDENKGMYLSYKPYDELTKLINNGDASAMNYFSMDSSNNIVVAGWETMEVYFEEPVQTDPDPADYPAPSNYFENVEPIQEPYSKLTTKSINYLDQISGYNMPFSLLWTLLVYGNDQNFVNDLAELVIDTEIVIGCYDATTVNVKTTDIEYTGQTKEEIVIPVEKTNDNPDHSSDKTTKTITVTYYFKVKEIDTRRTDNPTLKVNYANTWTAEYIREYKQEKKDTEVSDPSISESDEKTTIDQHIYQKVDDHYSGDRKPDDEILEELDKTIDTETDKALSENLEKGTKEANKYNQEHFNYRYTYLNNKMIEYKWNTDKRNLDVYKVLQKKRDSKSYYKYDNRWNDRIR